MDVAFTESEQKALTLITELQLIVDSLPEQHLYEQRQLSDAVSRVADGIFSRAGYRARYPDWIERYRDDPDAQADWMEQLRRTSLLNA